MVVHAYEAGKSLVQGSTALHSKFQASWENSLSPVSNTRPYWQVFGAENGKEPP